MSDIIELVNRVADAPDPTMRVKAFIDELRQKIEGTMGDIQFIGKLFDEMDEKAPFIASAIVSGGHVHLMAGRIDGRAT